MFIGIKFELLLQWKAKWTNIYNEDKTITISSNTDTPSLKRILITIPDTAINSFNECNDEAFLSNVKILLQIFSTIPVSTATTETSFSVLKLIKNYLRSTYYAREQIK